MIGLSLYNSLTLMGQELQKITIEEKKIGKLPIEV